MRQGCILIQHLLNLYTDSVGDTRDIGYFEELGIKTGGTLVYNLRNQDDITIVLNE